MSTTTSPQGAARVGALALVLLMGGCSGSGIEPAGTRLSSQSGIVPLGVGTCAPSTNSLNFNGTPIPAGSFIWFSSVFSAPGYNGPLALTVSDSTITFTSGGQTYSFKGPGMDLSLQSPQTLNFDITNGQWQLTAPFGTAGNDFLTGIAYYVPNALPGGIKNVIWSAVFQSAQPHQIHWQAAAAVYNTFTGQYSQLGVKPLDDNHYAPNNSDHAGTPENYKQFVTGGATGGGGSNYTGSYGPTVNVTPCSCI